ncbi:hypothetical protein CLAIMM_14697 [Cladophialophora immunda]|nr:hypothetical protein CLAIMM_14697 [Cladophialophora immunda]
MGSAGATIGIVMLVIIILAVVVGIIGCLRRKQEAPPSNSVNRRQYNERWPSESYGTRQSGRTNRVNGKTARERGEVDPWEPRRDVRMQPIKPARVRRVHGEAYFTERFNHDNWV